MGTTGRFWKLYRQGVRTSLRNNASAYGYSLVATVSFGALSRIKSQPSLGEMFGYLFGAVAAFTVLEAFGSHMFRVKLRGDPSDVVALGSAFSFLSTGAAVGTAILIGWLIQGWVVWCAASFGSTCVYLLLLGVEMALAHRAEEGRAHSEE